MNIIKLRQSKLCTPLIALIISILLINTPVLAQEPTEANVNPDVEVALQQNDMVRIIVALRPPTFDAEIQSETDQIAQAQDSVISELSPDDFGLTHRYRTIAGLAGEVTSEGLETIRNNPNVMAVDLDMPVQATLAESGKLIRATQVWSEFGLTGKGVNVAVLDTGIEIAHPDLGDDLIAQKCFNHGTCPPNQTDESLSAQDENGHGTHVAGIISGRGTIAPSGIAPDAGIVAVRILNRAGSGWTSDVVEGIEWVVNNRAAFKIKVINMSLGGGGYETICDDDNANTILYADAIARAHQAGITIFAASGNEGLTNQIMAPACVSGVIAVGNVHDTATDQYVWPGCTDTNAKVDQVTCSSNSGMELDLLAPGTSIVSAGLGGGQVSLSGTSMATPHAAAVAALMLEAKSDLTPDEIEVILKTTGVPVTDKHTGRVTPRIDAFAAVSEIITPTTATFIAGTVLLQGRYIHTGTDVYVSQEACDVATFDEPITTTDKDGYFEIYLQPATVATTNYQCLLVVANKYLVGQYQNPRGKLGTIKLLGGDVNDDGLINILDISAIAMFYGKNDAASDLNADELVDILDLSIAAKNFKKAGPLSEWLR
jgi:subtilisin family serine protease